MKRTLLALLVAFSVMDAEILQVKQLFNFKTVPVRKEVRAVSHTYYARTAVDERRVRTVSLRFSGFVSRLYADSRYRFVHQGEPLFRIYSDAVSDAVEELRLGRRFSKETRRNAFLKLKLLGVSYLAKGGMDGNYTFDFRSPFSGYIIEKKIDEGSFVPKGKTVLKIADFSELWVIADIYQKDRRVIRPGMDAQIEVEGFGRFKGRVDMLYPTVDPKTQTIPLRIVLQNDAGLFPGLFAKVTLFEKAKTRLVLPRTAVLKKDTKQYVFIPQPDGTFLPRAITAKRIDAQRYEIVSGLSEGEKVADKVLFLLDSDALTNALYDTDEDEDW